MRLFDHSSDVRQLLVVVPGWEAVFTHNRIYLGMGFLLNFWPCHQCLDGRGEHGSGSVRASFDGDASEKCNLVCCQSGLFLCLQEPVNDAVCRTYRFAPSHDRSEQPLVQLVQRGVNDFCSSDPIAEKSLGNQLQKWENVDRGRRAKLIDSGPELDGITELDRVARHSRFGTNTVD